MLESPEPGSADAYYVSELKAVRDYLDEALARLEIPRERTPADLRENVCAIASYTADRLGRVATLTN